MQRGVVNTHVYLAPVRHGRWLQGVSSRHLDIRYTYMQHEVVTTRSYYLVHERPRDILEVTPLQHLGRHLSSMQYEVVTSHAYLVLEHPWGMLEADPTPHPRMHYANMQSEVAKSHTCDVS
jgi:hypothetical protein